MLAQSVFKDLCSTSCVCVYSEALCNVILVKERQILRRRAEQRDVR